LLLSCVALSAWAQTGATLPYDVLLGRPTDRSVALSILASDNREVVIDYGTQSGVYPKQTAMTVLATGVPSVVTLDGLDPDTAYFYRIRHRAAGTTAYTAASEARFVTQRAKGKAFTFVIEADPHHLDNEPAVWKAALANMLADQPDFLIDIGDTFMDEKYGYSTYAELVQTRKDVRAGYFGTVGHSLPLFLVNGNHDPELGWLIKPATPQENLAAWGVKARQYYYPNPVPGGFYSGATVNDPYLGAPRDAYYAFEWGDALFISLDPFWYSSQGTSKSKDPWLWTLGRAQYDWLKATLEKSKATFKFVFMHHIVGGSFDTLARGGVEFAPYFEWGGKNMDDTPGFAAKRPGWPMPIQDLLLANNVNVVFHGHDHLYIKQDLDTNGDGVPELIYQEVPQPCRTNQNTSSATPYGYRVGVMYPSSGHLRVRVTPQQATVEYVRVVIPTDTRAGVPNGTVQHSYTIKAASAPPAAPSRLVNLSVRSSTGAGNDSLIVGLVVGGSGGNLPVLMRAAGPTLGSFGVPGVLADPVLTLNGSNGAVISSNDDWSTGSNPAAISAAATQAGAFPFPNNSRDSALIAALAPGAYTARVDGKSAATGIALMEAYQSGTAAASLINVSARTRVGTGGDLLIAGFVVQGEAPKRVLIRAVGPGLNAFGVGGTLVDPQLSLYLQGTPAPIQQNDNWSTDATAAAQITSTSNAVGAFALTPGSKDSALIATLAPGAYTAQVSGVGGTSGVALVEIYEVP
jgi:hypothetical protein